MPLCYHKRFLKETKTYSIAKTDKKKNTFYANHTDSLPSKNELVDQIETNLKHLQGQKKLLQKVKDGKTWKHTFSLNENRNNKNQEGASIMKQCNSRCNVDRCQFCDVLRTIVGTKSVKVTDSYTQIGSSLNNLNSKRNGRGSPSRDLHKCSNFGQNVHLPSDKSSSNAELKIFKKLSSVKKVNCKTQTNVSNGHSNRLLSHQQKIFMSESPSLEYRQESPALKSNAFEQLKCAPSLDYRSTAPETSYDSQTFQNVNKSLPKSVEAKSMYTKNSKNLPEFMIATQSPRNEKHKNKDMTLSPRSPKADGQTLNRTASSIRRHAKLSKEILDYARWITEQRILQKTNEEKPCRKMQCSEVFNKSLQSPHEILTQDSEISEAYRNLDQSKKRTFVKPINNRDAFIKVNNPDGRKYCDKKEHRKDDDEMGRSKSNYLSGNSCFSKSHTVNTIKPINVIDDSTYVCPDNSEENDYLLLPYVGNTSEDNVNLNLSPKPEREQSDHNRDSRLEEITSKSVVVLEDTSCQLPSKPRSSIRNERKSRANDIHHEPQVKEGLFQNNVKQKINRTKNVSQKSDKSAYISHSLESTWESHANREGPLNSKFDTSHNNRIQTPIDYRSHYFNIEDHPVQSFSKQFSKKKSLSRKEISKPLTSDPYNAKEQLNDHNPTKLRPEMEQEKSMVIPVTELSKNNETSIWNPLHKQTTINAASPSPESTIHTPEKRFSIKSYSNNDQINNQAFELNPEKLHLKNSSLHANLNSSINKETRISVAKESGKNEMLGESLHSYQCSSDFEDTRNKIQAKTSIVDKNEVLVKKSFKTQPVQVLTYQESELGAISKRPISMNPRIETPEFRIPSTIKSPIKDDPHQRDTKEDTILKNNNFKGIADSFLSLTPRQKFTSSDSDIQEKVFKQRKHISTQICDDLISKPFNLESGAVSKKDTSQNRPRFGESKNDIQRRFSLPVKENQLNLQTLQVSDNNELAPISNGFDLGAISGNRDFIHPSLPTKTKEYETQDIPRGPPRCEPKIDDSFREICSKKDLILQTNASRDDQSARRKSDPNYKIKDFKLGAIPKMSSSDSFSLTAQLKEFETQDSSRKHLKDVQTIDTVTGEITLAYEPEQKSQETTHKANNSTVYLKSGLNYDADVGISPSSPEILSGLSSDSTVKTSAKGRDYHDKSQLQSSISVSSFSSYVSHKPQRSEPKIYASSEPLKHHTPKAYQSTEKSIPRSKHISESFGSTSNGPELGAIPKSYGNENNLALKPLSNQGSLSLSALPDIFKTQSLPQKPPQSYPELNNSTGRIPSPFETSSQKQSLESHHSADGISEANNKSDTDTVSISSGINPYKIIEQDQSLMSNDIKEPEFQPNCKKLLSQQSLTKTNKSSGSQYLESFWNKNEAVRHIFRTTASKFRHNSNISRSSKSSQDFGNDDKLEASENSGRSKLSSISTYSFKTEKTNAESIDKKIEEKEKCNIFNRTKPTTPDPNMSLSFPRPEDWPSINLKQEPSYTQTENQLNENFNNQKHALSRNNERLNEAKGNVKTEKRVFLSDTLNQNNTVEGVSPEISDLIQHLNNRIKDCDENARNQSEELEKLKKHCKEIGPSTSIAVSEKEDEQTNQQYLKEYAEKELLENIGMHEPSIREDILDNDIKEENSCHCLFCGEEQSISYSSAEIPSFTGCECMKEDYYTIMRIAYNK